MLHVLVFLVSLGARAIRAMCRGRADLVIVRHGFYRTRSGKRRRYRCVALWKDVLCNQGTPYYRLQHRRANFDAVVSLRVEGVSISAIARIEGIAWNTVARWLQKAQVPRTSEIRDPWA